MKIQNELVVAEKHLADVRALANSSIFGHAGRGARARLDALKEAAAKKVHDLKKREAGYLQTLASMPDMAAMEKAAQEERRQTEQYLLEVKHWLDDIQPSVTHALTASEVQAVQAHAEVYTERPTKRARLSSPGTEDVDMDEWTELKENITELEAGIGNYDPAIAYGFADQARGVDALDEDMSQFAEIQDMLQDNLSMIVDGEQGGEEGELRPVSMHDAVAGSLERLEVAVTGLEKLVATCRAGELVDQQTRTTIAEDTRAMRERLEKVRTGCQSQLPRC